MGGGVGLRSAFDGNISYYTKKKIHISLDHSFESLVCNVLVCAGQEAMLGFAVMFTLGTSSWRRPP